MVVDTQLTRLDRAARESEEVDSGGTLVLLKGFSSFAKSMAGHALYWVEKFWWI